uniref:Protein kinase domain-containing protein n=1 Tax=Globisporangium ultimum (strain ATCC 200006 / CBS 805.95 / DAOM BR144) TaxID=431595 RepID=K3WPX8_GLOUD
MSLKDAVDKPDIKDFRIEAQIGEGNFSRIVRATYTPTQETFALKVVEKQRVKRLRIRHANIFNEINMEKEVLNKLRHPNIIRLYHTFQDNDKLYFLLEFLDGGELLDHLIHEKRQIGLHEDTVRFYLADVVNAIEYVHANQIIHRDLKPENMVVCKDTNHLKLIDFGTAKNLADTALNGPNFVGTPEYMSPETIDNKDVTFASDLWALGCIVFQLCTGETPFSGGSAYLTFLKVQDGSFHLPEYLSDEAKDLITKLLQKDPKARLGSGEAGINDIKVHPFFRGIDFDNHMQAPLPATKFQDIALLSLAGELGKAERKRDPNLSIDFGSDKLQQRISTLNSNERSLLMHLLKRKQLLHLPGIYPRFFDSVAHGRCRYASQQGYVGFSHDLQNQWTDTFSFMQLAGPCLGRAAAAKENDSRGGSTWDAEAIAFQHAIDVINQKTPAFVVICGDFVNALPAQPFYTAQINAFQHLVNGIRSSIRLVFVPGSSAAENSPTRSLEAYEQSFGDSRYSFWFGGMKFIVMNSSLLCHPDEFADKTERQQVWLKKELENGRLCARGTAVFAFHNLCEEGNGTSAENNDESVLVTSLPSQTRKQYSDLILQAQTSLLVTSHPALDQAFHVVTKAPQSQGDGDENGDTTAVEEHKCEVLCCKTPWEPGSSTPTIHIVKVAQDGITTQRCVVELSRSATVAAAVTNDHEVKAVPEPEQIDTSLSLQGVTLDITA